MADTNTISGNLIVRGRLSAGAFDVPAASIGDAQATTSDPLDTDKVRHRHEVNIMQSGTATTATYLIHPRAAAGTVSISASSLTIAVGAATVGVVLKKNGSSIMSSSLTLDTGNTIGVVEAGSLSSSSYSANDYFSVEITATAGGGTLPTGLNVCVVFNEDPA